MIAYLSVLLRSFIASSPYLQSITQFSWLRLRTTNFHNFKSHHLLHLTRLLPLVVFMYDQIILPWRIGNEAHVLYYACISTSLFPYSTTASKFLCIQAERLPASNYSSNHPCSMELRRTKARRRWSRQNGKSVEPREDCELSIILTTQRSKHLILCIA